MLFNLLAVRDIGVLNIAKLYSSQAILNEHQLDFVIDLSNNRDGCISNDITHPYGEVTILAQKFPSQTIFAFAERNLAFIVETALKNYILYKFGQDAGRELVARQQQYL